MKKETKGVKNAAQISFDRLHALVHKGYQPIFAGNLSEQGISSIELRHAKIRGIGAPPPITLWSNGIVSTTAILWPKQYVATSSGPPAWQKFIDFEDDARFDRFVDEVPKPNIYDLYISTVFREVRVATYMCIFAVTLCSILGLAYKLIPAATATVA